MRTSKFLALIVLATVPFLAALQATPTSVEVTKGRIALQSEGAYIEFKNITLTKIIKP